MKLIIQVPAYNEEATIGRTLADLPKRIDGISSIEVLVIDDGSIDKTVEAARRAGANYVVRLLNHRGLSTAFVAGVDAALKLGADIIVNTDADNQYRGADIARLVAPIARGSAEVVIGDRDVQKSPHMGAGKKFLQRFGSWAVGKAAGVRVPDVTSGFRAFSREAAYQINVFNPFTYTLETVIQAGNRNLGVQSVQVGTNPPTRPSRLYDGIGRYVWKSTFTIFRIYTVYRPLKTFVAIGSLLFLVGVALGIRFLYYFFTGEPGGHIQSLILAAVLLIIGFQTALIGLVADLIAVNRRLSEDVLVRLKKMEPRSDRPRHREHRPAERERRPQPRSEEKREPREPREPRDPRVPEPQPQWVWLLDEAKLETRGGTPVLEEEPVATEEAVTPSLQARRRRRRRRFRPRRPGEVTTGSTEAAPPPPETDEDQ